MRSRIVVMALVASACSAPPPIDRPVVPPATIDTKPSDAAPPPSGWRYHPPSLAGVLDQRRLPDGRWLLAGELGERWLTEGEGETMTADAATSRAPEPLVQILRWDEGQDARWLFLGESGTTYFARDPLGPMSRGARAPAPIAAIATTPGGAFAVDRLGRHLRFDGENWTAAPAEPRLFALASDASGGLVGLGLPERLWRSDDEGATWRALDLGPFGTEGLIRGEQGDVVVLGAVGRFRVDGEGKAQPLDGEEPEPEEVLPAPNRGPQAEAVLEHDATLDAGRYRELRQPPNGEGWELFGGPLGGPYRSRSLALEDCEGVVLASANEHLWILCGGDGDERVRLFHADGEGERLRGVATLNAAAVDLVSIAADDRGRAFITGVCPSAEPDCDLRGPLVVTADGKQQKTTAPSLVSAAFEPAVADGGRRAFFLGERAKDRQLALFVSSDGRNFTPEPLEPPPGYTGPWEMDPDIDRWLHVASDGAVGLVIDSQPLTYVVFSARGRLESVARLPDRTVAVGGQGRHVLAIVTERIEGAPLGLRVMASSDAGLSFREQPLPMQLELDEFESQPAVACGRTGCVIGDRLTRLGFEVSEPLADTMRAPPVPATVARPAVRTPFVCTAEGAWTEIDQIAFDYLVPPPPSAAMRGDAAWSVMRFDKKRGVVDSVAMTLSGAGAKLERRRLFGPVPRRRDWAYAVIPQMEGHAAARLRLPRERSGDSRMRGLEIEWVNDLAKTRGRLRIDDAGPLADEDVTPGEEPHLVTGLVSVAPKGIVVRPSALRDDTWAVDERGRVLGREPYPQWPPTRYRDQQLDATLIDGRAFGAAQHASARATTISLLAMGTQNATFTTTAMPAAGRTTEIGWTYRAQQTGVATQLYDPATGEGFAYFAPFTAAGRLGEPVPLPTQRQLADLPKPCSASERARGSRVVSLYTTGTRHPVLVRDGTEDLLMLTGSAVLYGTADAPCLAAWHARSFAQRGAARVAIIGGGLAQAWLFESRARRTLAFRPMRCEAAPSRALPPVFWSQPGTVEDRP